MKVFHVPRTLDEILTAITFVVWPFLYYFLLRPIDMTAAGEVVGFVLMMAIEGGIAVAMKNARDHA